nr:hypothetical protein GCM10020241_13410 [Streptoalloteichus tenebrarius]
MLPILPSPPAVSRHTERVGAPRSRWQRAVALATQAALAPHGSWSQMAQWRGTAPRDAGESRVTRSRSRIVGLDADGKAPKCSPAKSSSPPTTEDGRDPEPAP